MHSFYFNCASMVDQSLWDETNKKVIVHHSMAANTWLEDIIKLDPLQRAGEVVYFGSSDSEQLSIL